ncbi:MAG: four helix bundle protein [Saprospiraceae bacterium]
MEKDKAKDNVIVSKSFEFALDIIDLYGELKKNNHYEIAKQVIRSGTSIGANVREAQRAVSKADFVNKIGISLKEADETKYWFEIIDAKILPVKNELKIKIEEIIKILVSIINRIKSNNS